MEAETPKIQTNEYWRMVKYLINMTPRYYDILMLDIPEEEMIKIMEGEIDNGEEEAIRTI
jgi:hypothetical protein